MVVGGRGRVGNLAEKRAVQSGMQKKQAYHNDAQALHVLAMSKGLA